MRKIFLDFLSDSDYQGLSYKAAAQTNLRNVPQEAIIRCCNLTDFQNALGNIRTDDGPVMLTVFSHGKPDHLLAAINGVLVEVLYKDLLLSVSQCRTLYPLYLNLSGVCNSIHSADYMSSSKGIDEIWGTTLNTPSLNKALLAAEAGSFDDFYAELDGDEKVLYAVMRFEH